MATEIGGRDGKGGMVHGIRSLGSSTMDMVYIASGQGDIMFEGTISTKSFEGGDLLSAI